MNKYRAEFIGKNNQCVKRIDVDAETPGAAIEKAKAVYKENGWDFWFDNIELKEEVNFDFLRGE